MDSAADRKTTIIDTAIIAAALTLPTLEPAMFGPLAGLIPLPVFFFLVRHGNIKGSAIIRNGALITVILCALAGTLPQVFFIISLIPVGFVMAHAAEKKLPPVHTTLIGISVLALTWILFWSVIGMAHSANPYAELREVIDLGLAEVATYYQGNKAFPADIKIEIGSAILEMRSLVPRILPALLALMVLYTVWVNQVLGNWVIRRFLPGQAPWPPFTEWKLPDNLVWIGIGSGLVFLMLSGPIKDIGLNILLVSAAVYAFQGMAVVSSLLNRWSVVKPLRVAIYLLILLQRYGIIFLAILGVADIWLDFRNRPFTFGGSGSDQQSEE